MGTLREDVYTFMLIFRQVLLRVRKAWGWGAFIENQNKFYVQHFFPKIVPFMG